MLFQWLSHRRACNDKQEERRKRIQDLPPIFHEPLNVGEQGILDTPVGTLSAAIRAHTLDPVDVLTAYAKKALRAHAETNCLTEVMIAAAVGWAKNCNKQGPLAGVPVSLKDTVGVKGWDGCIGYSAWVGKPAQKDSALVRLLRDAGAVPFVKTNVPITLLSFESSNDVFGRTTNPHKSSHSPGGSTGGEAALLAYGGSRIGIGTDVAGSVRAPAHYSGIYTIKASVGRFLKMGSSTSMPGQEGVAPVYSPMARTLDDLEYFWKAVIGMEPWKYDHSCLPIPWRTVDLSKKPLKWGVMWDDGVVLPSPACQRALEIVVNTLRRNGHEIIAINPPSPYGGLKLGASLILADGGKTCTAPMRTWVESNDVGMVQPLRMLNLPSFLRRLYIFYVRYIKRDEIYAGILDGWYEKKVVEFWPLVAKREEYKGRWFDFWKEEKLDFVLTVPNALPAVPHDGMKNGFSSCGYTFLFNLLDYSAGVLPITHVDSSADQLGTFKPRNAIERYAYLDYNAKDMHGLPVGVQVVGQRLEEEKVMEGMKIIKSLLRREGLDYKLLNGA
ncbi:amidase signature domain-containing protein [Gymnopilus junonius]|uniref:amidase n=1 Tax=Gymnopilus junonius TaxID=109634 RepID=A0A9P5TS27_GYMJU|nr:amidase signature domain-containing protein [Gymnopilus junonius]